MRILVVDDEQHICDACRKALERVGYEVASFTNAAEALDSLADGDYDLALVDIRMPHIDGVSFLDRAKEIDSELIVIMMTGYASVDTAIASMKRGAFHYVAKPFTADEIRRLVSEALALRMRTADTHVLREELRGTFERVIIFGVSRAMKKLHGLVTKVAQGESNVLISGESGTGKELVARMIHMRGPRAKGPFVAVNCAAIPPTLLESELFGHRKGAFTGAEYDRRGSFELASDGTLFLDEIADMHAEMQAKILRTIEDREVKRIGAEESVEVNVRLVAATNRNIEAEVKAGRFREDLYFRLNVMRIDLPPLRKHKEDIPLLAEHFLTQFSQEMKKGTHGFSDDALEVLSQYHWPGNIRELENAVERAVMLSEGPLLRRSAFAGFLGAQADSVQAKAIARPLAEVEMEHIQRVLELCGGNRTKAAKILGITPVTLWRKLGKK